MASRCRAPWVKAQPAPVSVSAGLANVLWPGPRPRDPPPAGLPVGPAALPHQLSPSNQLPLQPLLRVILPVPALPQQNFVLPHSFHKQSVSLYSSCLLLTSSS